MAAYKLLCLLAAVFALVSFPASALTCYVKPHLGAPALLIDGKPVPPLIFFCRAELDYPPTPLEIGTEWRKYTLTFTPPEDNEGEAAFQLRLGGYSGTVWLDDVQLHEGRPGALKGPNLIPEGDFEGDFASVEQYWKYWKTSKRTIDFNWALDRTTAAHGQSSLKLEVGRAGVDPIDIHIFREALSFKKGRPYTLTFYLKGTKPGDLQGQVLRKGGSWRRYSGEELLPFISQLKEAASNGIHLVSTIIPFPWSQPGAKADYSYTDEVFERILRVDPQALIIPRISMRPPNWWCQTHPEELAQWSDGKSDYPIPSIASKAWLADLKPQLADFVKHCESKYGDHIIGYHPSSLNTGEWFYNRSWAQVEGQIEEPFRRGFGQWALEKYGSLAALRKAWGEPHLELETLQLPTLAERRSALVGFFREPKQERKVIDFHLYQQVAVTDFLEAIAHELKELTGGRKLTVFFYGYYFELAGMPTGVQNSGHLALRRLLDDPDVDILASPLSYANRGRGGLSFFMSAVDSLAANGKLWLIEDDTRTWVAWEHRKEWHTRVPGPHTPQETTWEIDRTFGQLFPRRLATWYMDLKGQGWWDLPDLWRHIGKLKTRYAEALQTPCRWQPEFAVVVDESSPCYMADTWQLMRNGLSFAREDFYRAGAPFGLYLLSDVLSGKVKLPKLTYFLGCWHLSEADRARLKELTQGKNVIFGYGTGFLSDEAASAANMEDLMGFKFKQELGSAGVRFAGGPSPVLAGIENEPYGPVKLELVPRWAVAPGGGIETLATFDTDETAIAFKREADGSFKVYLGTIRCPPQFFRNLLKAAGAHVWLESNDQLNASENFLEVCAHEGGVKALLVPAGVTGLQRWDTGEVLPAEGGKVEETFAPGETRLYRVLHGESGG